MKIELVKQIFDRSRGYKIKKMTWCCDKLKSNPYIDLLDEYAEGKDDVPAIMIRITELIRDWEDELEQDYYYPISYCPFCGKPIEISVIDKEDVSEAFKVLEKQRKKLFEECQRTDSKKKEQELRNKVQNLDDRIDWFYQLTNYNKTING